MDDFPMPTEGAFIIRIGCWGLLLIIVIVICPYQGPYIREGLHWVSVAFKGCFVWDLGLGCRVWGFWFWKVSDFSPRNSGAQDGASYGLTLR